jgi:hypothetical protein
VPSVIQQASPESCIRQACRSVTLVAPCSSSPSACTRHCDARGSHVACCEKHHSAFQVRLVTTNVHSSTVVGYCCQSHLFTELGARRQWVNISLECDEPNDTDRCFISPYTTQRHRKLQSAPQTRQRISYGSFNWAPLWVPAGTSLPLNP